MKTLNIFLVLISMALAGFAQVKDTIATADVIVQVDGQVVYGIIVEVNSYEVKYRNNQVPNSPLITLPRDLVYLISYSNNTQQIITPTFGKTKISKTSFDENRLEDSNNKDFIEKDLLYNMARGSIKVGMGFTGDFSRIKGIEDFTKEESFPLIGINYEFQFSRLFITGVAIGYGSNNYSYSSFSDYDQIDINQYVVETIYSIGGYGRYNITNSFFRPYILAGLNFNYTVGENTGNIFFRDESKNVATKTSIKGFKAIVLARVGIDLHIGNKFGVYTDFGLGNSLVNVGVKFILE